MAVNPHIKFSYEDYKSLPFSEEKQYELLGGEIIRVPSPRPRHQIISSALEFELRQFVKERQFGTVLHAPLDIVLGQGDERDVAQPDILYISTDRVDIIQEDENRGAPDLVIEIASPSTAEYDRGYKRSLYARSGVREYWIVDPDAETVEVYSLTESGYELSERFTRSDTLTSLLLTDLEIPLADVFDS